MLQKSVIRRTKPNEPTESTSLPLDLFDVPCIADIDGAGHPRMLSIHDANAMRSGKGDRRFFPDCDEITGTHSTLAWRGERFGIVKADRAEMESDLLAEVKIDTDHRPYGGAPVAEPQVVVEEEVTIPFRREDELNVVPLHTLRPSKRATTPCGQFEADVTATLVRVDWAAGLATYHAEI